MAEGAIPTIFPGVPQSCIKQISKPRKNPKERKFVNNESKFGTQLIHFQGPPGKYLLIIRYYKNFINKSI